MSTGICTDSTAGAHRPCLSVSPSWHPTICYFSVKPTAGDLNWLQVTGSTAWEHCVLATLQLLLAQDRSVVWPWGLTWECEGTGGGGTGSGAAYQLLGLGPHDCDTLSA